MEESSLVKQLLLMLLSDLLLHILADNKHEAFSVKTEVPHSKDNTDLTLTKFAKCFIFYIFK